MSDSWHGGQLLDEELVGGAVDALLEPPTAVVTARFPPQLALDGIFEVLEKPQMRIKERASFTAP